jgi:NADH:ubiquinone oxidoreductase subunit 6 (subunit J)
MTLVPLIIMLLTLGSAAVAMMLRNLIHSALLLILSWAGLAAFYLWAGAEFVAFAQVLVYVGAVSMVVLFAVLLTRRSRADLEVPSPALQRILLAVIPAALIAGLLIGAVLGAFPETTYKPAPELTVKQIGWALMDPHAASLLVVGILLTVTLLGAVVIASPEKPEDKP